MPTASLIRAELLKIRKRWLPYMLLAVMLIGVALTVWVVGLGTWYDERGDAEYEFGASSLRTFVLPWAFVTLLDVGQFYGAALISVLAASVVATEYNWGTVRQALVRGQSRASYLTIKLIGAVIIATVSLLLALGVGVLFAVIASLIADKPVTFDVPGGPSAPEVVLMVLRTALAIIPYGLLAFCLAVVGRSTTVGIVGTFLYIFVLESILLGVLGALGGPAPHFQLLFMGHSAAALLAANRIGAGDYNSFAFRELPSVSDTPDPWAAALLLVAFSAVLLAITYYVFQRRDLGTDGGGG